MTCDHTWSGIVEKCDRCGEPKVESDRALMARMAAVLRDHTGECSITGTYWDNDDVIAVLAEYDQYLTLS